MPLNTVFSQLKFTDRNSFRLVEYNINSDHVIVDIAAELAAKKSRVKQSLIKRARSVAIFSLKLKERRAREAEKQALAAAEHAKVSFKTFSNDYLFDSTITIDLLIIGHKSSSARRRIGSHWH